jgi:hypothetical protein
MFKIICGSSIGIEHISYRLAREYGFKTEGYYIDFENENFKTMDGDGMIQLPVSTKQKEKVVKNLEKADIAIVLRRQIGGNSANVDLTIGYCKCKKWKKEFNFHLCEKRYRHCIVVMDPISDEAIPSSIEQDVKKIIDYIKIRNLRSIYITGHTFQFKSSYVAKFEEKVKAFLVSLFDAFKELFFKPDDTFVQEKTMSQDVSTSLFEQSTMNSLLFLAPSPQISNSPTTPSSAKRLLTCVESKQINESGESEDSPEIMKREILSQKRLLSSSSSSSSPSSSFNQQPTFHFTDTPIPYFHSSREEYPSLEKRILSSFLTMEDQPFLKRSRLN